ncbi:hypothetical protein GCM10022409_21070 [Hymenobacter glaciei]|uniref:Uncharacterized protein n=1 Tax=Hymenobacter glaciei TaxID=877209 RepID=A0ABP7U4H4_9BACT
MALLASIATVEADSFYQKHERYLALHGCGFMAYVYQEAIVQILLDANLDERYELCGVFRRVMSQSIDAHFGQMELTDHTLRVGLADNARQWLAFLHSMSLADKTSFQSVHLGFLTSYGCNFMSQVYYDTFECALRPGGLVAPDRILAPFEQALGQGLKKAATARPD